MPTYSFNPELEIIKPDFEGNPKEGNAFLNVWRKLQRPPMNKMLDWALTGAGKRKEKKADSYRPKLIPNTSFLQQDHDWIVWMGHASFLFRINGVTILTDPCYSDLPFLKRQVGIPMDYSELTGIDYILLSHGHRDHFDTPSLKKILQYNPNIRFLVPMEMGKRLLYPMGHDNWQEAAWFQKFELKDERLEIFFLPAAHWHRRGLWDENVVLWGSFWIRANGKNLYFAGDTGYNGHFQQIREVMGEADVCLMPIGAYHPSFIMRPQHTNPEEAAKAFQELGGKHFLPMHYGTYDLASEPRSEPIRWARRLNETELLNGALQELAVGEEFAF